MTTDKSRLGIYILDVGQGDCTFVVPPLGEGDPVLVDCNDAYVAERFVSNHDIKRLRAVVASHLDRDHIRGIVPFLETYFASSNVVDELFVGADRPLDNAEEDSEIAVLLERALTWEKQPPCSGFSLANPTRTKYPSVISRGTDWKIELVLPYYSTALSATMGEEDANTVSAVLRVSRGGRAVLVGGDATIESWERLEPGLLSADGIRIAHHGGDLGKGAKWSGAADLYKSVGAKHAFISVGSNNGYQHPLEEHVEAIRSANRNCRVRCTQLTPRCHPNPSLLRQAALDIAGGVEWPYRHRVQPGSPSRSRPTNETPCAASMVVWLESSGELEIEPRPRGVHDRFLNKVRKPLCKGA